MKSSIIGGLALGMLVFAPLGRSAITDALNLTDGAGDIINVSAAGVVTFGGSCTVATCTTTAVSGSAGTITFEGTIGTFSFTLDTGQDPLVLSAPQLMDLTTNDIKSAGAGSLTISYSASGITGNTGFVMTDGGTQSAGSASVDYTTWTGVALFATTTEIGTTGAVAGSPFSSTLGSSVLSGAGPYSLTQVVKLTFTAAGDDSGDFALAGTPEPTSVALLGSVVLLTAGAIRRRRRTA